MDKHQPDVFLSYSREDQVVARRFAEALKLEGFMVWWDQALSTGEAYDAVTEEALDGARAVVVLWSATSVKSRWVRAEATTADRNGVLMPAMIGACRRPVMFELTQTAELQQWQGDRNDPSWRAFVADLKRLVLRGQPPEAAALLERAAGQAPGVPVPPAVAARPRSRWRNIIAVAVAAALIGMAGFFLWQRPHSMRGEAATVAEISALVNAGDFPSAFAKAQLLDEHSRSRLQFLEPLYSAKYSISTEPAGAEVKYRRYDSVDAPWQSLGVTPINEATIPRQATRWHIERAGFEPLDFATTADDTTPVPGGANVVGLRPKRALKFSLARTGELPAGMVVIPGGVSQAIRGIAGKQVPSFLIDRTEVTNARYKEFVEAGGYERRSFWEGLDLRQGGKSLSFEQAMRLFVDSTGRPGPSTWELGSYPEGRGDYPVTGVSEYEAAAYARFRGGSLPSLYHWARAALPDGEQFNSLAASMLPLSNFGTADALPVGKGQGMGPYGTVDMLGNAREWVVNSDNGNGWLIGGSWLDATYSYASPAPAARLDRSRVNGFRLIKESERADASLSAPLVAANSDFTRAVPVSDQVYATLSRQYTYKSGALNASAPVTMATTEEWTKQRVTIDAGYEGKRMDVILFIPRHAQQPLQPIIYFSGANYFLFPSTLEEIEPWFEGISADFIIRSGRMLVFPVFEGSVNRFKTAVDLNDPVNAARLLVAWRWDLGRTIDYLQTRNDVDSGRLGYLGISLGATMALPIVALEPRLKSAVLISGGIPPTNVTSSPLTDVVNFAPRISIPVLMYNGRFDPYITPTGNQQPLFRLLGTPSRDKRYVQGDFSHMSPPRAELLRETLDWYDRYLGKVAQ